MANLLAYWWRVFAKTLSFALFGIGALLLSLLVFPAVRLLVHPRWRFRRALRRTVSASFWLFVWVMRLLGLIRVRIQSPERLRAARGVIVAANHPSLIDVVILIAHLPQADCIVKTQLWSNPFVRGVVGSLYIPNSLDFEDTVAACAASLAEGNSLVVFPEGTRTASDSAPRLKRGSARLALRLGCDIQPVLIQASDPRGLRKGDPLFSYTRAGPMCFAVQPLEPIPISSFLGQEPARAARFLTREIEARIVKLPVDSLELEVKRLIVSALDLEDVKPEDINTDDPLFNDGLGLDSIDALELGIAIKKKYDVSFTAEDKENRKHFASVAALASFIRSARP